MFKVSPTFNIFPDYYLIDLYLSLLIMGDYLIFPKTIYTPYPIYYSSKNLALFPINPHYLSSYQYYKSPNHQYNSKKDLNT